MMLVNNLPKVTLLITGRVLLAPSGGPTSHDTNGCCCPHPRSVRPLPLAGWWCSSSQWQLPPGSDSHMSVGRGNWLQPAATSQGCLNPLRETCPAPAGAQMQMELQSKRYIKVLNTRIRKTITYLWNSEVHSLLHRYLLNYL